MALKRNMHGSPQSVGNGVTPGSFAPKILGAPTKCLDSVETADWRTELDELTSPWAPEWHDLLPINGNELRLEEPLTLSSD